MIAGCKANHLEILVIRYQGYNDASSHCCAFIDTLYIDCQAGGRTDGNLSLIGEFYISFVLGEILQQIIIREGKELEKFRRMYGIDPTKSSFFSYGQTDDAAKGDSGKDAQKSSVF